MTHLILGLNNYLSGPITYLIGIVYTTIQKIIESVETANNSRAQYEVAIMLHREFRNESFDYVFNMVRQGTVNELVK